MSVLSYICDYGSDTDDSESSEATKITRTKLPKPKLDGVAVVGAELHSDDPDLHHGKVRSFPHERGNWASFVHIKFGAQKFLHDLVKRIQLVTDVVTPLRAVDNVHVSVSRTVVLKYHLISTFNGSMKKALESLSSFDLEFESLKVYCNEERSRTFVALQVCHLSSKYLLKISQSVDGVLKEFSLPEFYEDPSFHASLLWTNGDKQEQLEQVLENFSIFGDEEPLSVYIDKVHSNIGNKQFQYPLD